MQNIHPLLGAEVEPSKFSTRNNSSSHSEEQRPNRKVSLDAVLQEFNDWRANKEHPGAAIPDTLWNKFFDLATLYPPTTLCGLLGISKPQYKKQRTLRTAQEQEKANPVADSSPSVLCQVKVAPQKSSYQSQPLPSAKTLVVELCRRDGQVMKIHTTQDSIDKIIQTFLSEVKV